MNIGLGFNTYPSKSKEMLLTLVYISKMWNNDIDLKITQLNSTLMSNSIDSLDVSTVSERETESESEPEIIALIY